MKHPVDQYDKLLRELHSHLTRYGEHQWTQVLEKWIAELEQMVRVQTPLSGFAAHLDRTRQSFGGMGSLNDIAITPQAGYDILNWKASRVNAKLRKLTTALLNETERLLRF
ncbi:MAG TPA: hypothetical protein VFA68_13525 [Terriglobales bacterium]|nr:hypothetical protein [Terriglobales bacterium]